MKINILENTTYEDEINKTENKKWKGLGMVSANNSSRLLLDYKEIYPDVYNKILNLIFGQEGLCVNHLKIEMGSDINSSSGTEPCTKRFVNEECDVRRGAGFVLCADAKKINPDITLDMLWWSEPSWVSNAENVFEARYIWYKENLISAYKTYGLVFDYVSVTQNERGWSPDWMKYLSDALKNEKNAPYDFSKIKLIAGEEVCTWNIADLMMNDPQLQKCIDVIGSHYTSWNTENAEKLRNLGKEIWMSEGSSSMGYSKGIARFDSKSHGLGGLNNILDIASRLITMYAKGHMTMCELQPVISSYYDGVCYCHKQFITANTPWNGCFSLDTGFFMALHFSQFIKKGWILFDNQCEGDGKAGGDGHCIVDSKYNYLCAWNEKSRDFSFVAVNCTEEKIDYEIDLSKLTEKGFSKKLFCYRTENWKKADSLHCENIPLKNKKTVNVTVNPFSIITLSSVFYEKNQVIKNLSLDDDSNISNDEIKNRILKLPYEDNIDYSDEFIKRRGGAPLFTTDQGGAFEIIQINNKKFLEQQVYLKDKAKEWGWTSEPVTTFGDDHWMNYTFITQIRFDQNCSDEHNYAGIGIRNNLPCDGYSGYVLRLYQNGKWAFWRNSKEIISGNLPSSPKNGNYILSLEARDNLISAEINGINLFNKSCEELGISIASSGRPALYSSWNRNFFCDMKVLPAKNNPYIRLYDDTDQVFEYSDGWNHSLMDSFKNYRRTLSSGKAGDSVNITFYGKGFYVTGKNDEETEIMVNDKIFKVMNAGFKDVLFYETGLDEGKHSFNVKILKGKLQIDALEVLI